MFVDGLEAALSEEPEIEVLGAAGTVSGAIRLIDLRPPDVVLCDQVLPDGDGIEIAERVRGKHPDCRVVIVTQLADETVIARAVDAGCSGYVSKERPVADVVAAIRAAAAGEAVISPDVLARLLRRYQRAPQGIGALLTAREHETLQLLAEGISNEAIANRLVVSLSTVRNHVQGVLQKLGAHSQLEAVVIAMREGLVERPGRRAT